MSKNTWTDFKSLGNLRFTKRDFCETLDGGQSFRWYPIDENCHIYEGVFCKNRVRLRRESDSSISISLPIKADFKKVCIETLDYLDHSRDYTLLRENLLKKSKDPIMQKAFEYYPTLRILRQNPTEALMCFICSSSKRIVQIKQCVKLLADKLGDKIDSQTNSLPSFERIAEAPLQTLLDCKLGFRANYLKKTAIKIIEDKFEPESLREAPYTEAKKYLTSLSGIGEKVADCILLFGAARFEAFPVDTWIIQGMDALYSTGKNPNKIREFANQKFGSHAGFAQQLIFASYRNGAVLK